MTGDFVLWKEYVLWHFKGFLLYQIYIHKEEFVYVGQSTVMPEDLGVTQSWI